MIQFRFTASLLKLFCFMSMLAFGPILFYLISQFVPASADYNIATQKQLASEKISLENRYGNSYVNGVFRDNILLTLAYLSGKVGSKEEIDWKKVSEPFTYKFTLEPDKTFAFHEDVLPEYKNTLVKTTNANFNFEDGFKSDGYLMGDGVCHLASLINWAAKEAGLSTLAHRNHDFAVIPEIAGEYGVAIYKMPGAIQANALQNLYVTNNKESTVEFEFSYKNGELEVTIKEVKI